MSVKKPDNLKVTFKSSDITVDIKEPKIEVCVDIPSVTIKPGAQIIRDTGDVPIYHGPYTVTPTQQEQTLNTHGYLLTGNVTVKKIPENYGLITWNGSVLTVS